MNVSDNYLINFHIKIPGGDKIWWNVNIETLIRLYMLRKSR